MESSTDKYVKELFLNVRANHPVTVVYTDDPNETISLTRDAIPNLRKNTDKVFCWSSRLAWTDITDKSKTYSQHLGNPNTVKLTAEQKKTPLALLFASPEELQCKAPVFIMSLLSMRFKKDVIEVLQELRDFDYMVRNQQNSSYRLIVIANKSFDIPDDYENIFGVVYHALPTKEELRATYRGSFLEDYCDGPLQGAMVKDSEEYPALRSELEDIEEYVINTLSGLSERQVKIILFKGVSKTVQKDSDGFVTGLDMDAFKVFLYETKFAEIKKSGIINLLKPIPMDQVGGLNNLKSWLLARTKAFSPEARAKGIKKPKGMILIGPSGTGKTYVAEATAGTLQMPCLQLNLSSVFSKYVGDSESHMESIKAQIEACAPAVVFIDEIDKIFPGGGQAGGDSGVTARVLGKLLSWVQDTKADLFFVLTANRAHNIPAELTRKGRFDEIWCVTFPTEQERTEILNIHLGKIGHTLANIANTVKETKDFSSAELEYIVQESALQAYLEDEELTEKHLITQAKLVNPIAISYKDDIAHMREWAEKHARWASNKDVYEVEDSKEF